MVPNNFHPLLCIFLVLPTMNKADLCNQQDMRQWWSVTLKARYETLQLPSCFLLDGSLYQAALWSSPFPQRTEASCQQPALICQLSEAATLGAASSSLQSAFRWLQPHLTSVYNPRDPQATTIKFRPLPNSWPSETVCNHNVYCFKLLSFQTTCSAAVDNL